MTNGSGTERVASIEAQFLARLSRSRSAQNRAQYLRIQAIELAGAGTNALTGQALALLERHLAEFSDPYERTRAHAAAADCCDKLDRVDSAIVHFRASLSEGVRAPNLDCGVRINFPWFIVSRRLINLYSEAIELLPSELPVFPVERFKVSTVKAVVSESRGQLEDARDTRTMRCRPLTNRPPSRGTPVWVSSTHVMLRRCAGFVSAQRPNKAMERTGMDKVPAERATRASSSPRTHLSAAAHRHR